MARTKQTARAAPATPDPETIESGVSVESGLKEEEFHREGIEGAFAALFVAEELGAHSTYVFRAEQKFPAFEGENKKGNYYAEFTYEGTLSLSGSQSLVSADGNAYVQRGPLLFGEVSSLAPVRGNTVKGKSIWAEVFFKIVCQLLRQGVDVSKIAFLREKFIDWAKEIDFDAAKPICETLKALLAKAELWTDEVSECNDDCLGDCEGKHNRKEDVLLLNGRRVIEILFAPIQSALKMFELDPSLRFGKLLRPRKRSASDESEYESSPKRSREESYEEPIDSTDEWAEGQSFSMPKFMEKLLRFLAREYAEFLDSCDPEDIMTPYNFVIDGIIHALKHEGRVHSDCAIPDDLNTELLRNLWAVKAMEEASGLENLYERFENAGRED